MSTGNTHQGGAPICLVTGISSGIGEAIGRTLLDAGTGKLCPHA